MCTGPLCSGVTIAKKKGPQSSSFSAKIVILLKMHSTLGLLSPMLLSLFSPIFAGPIGPSDSLPTKTTDNSRDPSQTWGAPGEAGSYECISPKEHPDWAGPINYDDCNDVYNVISNRFRDKEKTWTFWSREYRSRPPPNGFELPCGATIGKPFSQSLAAFHPFHSLTMTHSRHLYIGNPHCS